jgi:membrane-bound lytic murein transglycosylase D
MKKLVYFIILALALCAPRAYANVFSVKTPPKSDITDSEIRFVTQNETEAQLAQTISSSLSDAQDDNRNKEIIQEAETFYRKAVEAFENSNLDEARRNYNLSLSRLKSADIDPSLYVFFMEDYGRILSTLRNVYGASAPAASADKGYTVSMELPDNSVVEKYINLFEGTMKEEIKRAFERSGAYREMILKNLRLFELPEELLWLPVVESRFYNGNVSYAGAAGIWQIMEHRGRALGLQINYWIDERRDPEKATVAACLYLKQLYLMLNDWHLVLSAYNRGEYGLLRDMKFSNATNITEMRSRNAIPRETQNYAPQFIAAATIAENFKKYGFTGLNYDEPLQYDIVRTDKVIDLKIVAKCADTSVEEIQKLNPALKAWCTPQGYPGFELKIPYGTKRAFLEKIALEKDLNPSPGFIKHKIVKGDYLERLAARYKTTVSQIKKDNPCIAKQKYLQLNQVLIIRPGKKYYSAGK